MPTTNEIIADASIRHAVFATRLRLDESRRVRRFIEDRVLPDVMARLESRLARIRSRGFDSGVLTTRQLRALLRALDSVTDQGYARTLELLESRLGTIAFSEARFQAALGRAAGDFDWSIPSEAKLRGIVRSRPWRGKVLRGHWRRLNQTMRDAYRDSVQIGLAEGQTTAQIIRRVRARVEVPVAHAESVVRTAVTHTLTHARDYQFAENDDVLEGWEFIATLDTRTTTTCAGLDALGRVYPFGRGPLPPRHFRCRSANIPVVRGVARNRRDFEDWFFQQNPKTQDMAFGPVRAAALRARKLTIGDLTDENFAPLSLEEIEKREMLTLARTIVAA